MRPTKMFIANLFILGFFLAAAHVVQAQGRQVTVRVRTGDGHPLAGEEIILLSSPDDKAVSPNCVTDEQGECAWVVGRGIYQVQFVNRDLDDVSALAVAESGLNHFGITVGDEDIVYHFVFYRDGRIYFDQTPDAPIPSPIIPMLEDLHWSVETPVPAIILLESEPTRIPAESSANSSSPTPESKSMTETSQTAKWKTRLRLLTLVPAGLLIGTVLHLAGKRRNGGKSQSAPLTTKGEDRAART